MITKNTGKVLWSLMFVALVFIPVNTKCEEQKFVMAAPLIPSPTEWSFNDYWKQRKVGDRDFYMAEDGPYARLSKGGPKSLKQTGFFERTVPTCKGTLKHFDPKFMATESPEAKELWQSFLKNKWPVWSIEYCSSHGNPPPTKEALDAIGDLWIGDGHAEEPIYRLEPVFHFIKTGKNWVGSSTDYNKDQMMTDFFQKKMFPRLEKEVPSFRDPNHQWTRPELRKLCDIYCEEWIKPIGRYVDWVNFVSPYFIASLPETVAVGTSWTVDALASAKARGVMRQCGGNKFYIVISGHEHTGMYGYFPGTTYMVVSKDAYGYPLPHIWYFMYRPLLIGVNYYTQLQSPQIVDIEGDGQYELPIMGQIWKDMLDFADRHPERGVVYAPVALMTDYNRGLKLPSSDTFLGFHIPPFDDADQMNSGILNDLLFPEHRHIRGTSGSVSKAAPYGEIFDILAPNMPDKPADAKALENYKMLFAMGGLEINQDFARKIMDHVKKGGTLVINAEDVGKYLPADFLGVEILPDTYKAAETACTVCGKKIEEKSFVGRVMKLRKGAEAVITAKDGQPVVSKNHYGKGTVIVVGAPYMIRKEAVETTDEYSGRRWQKKALLNMVPHFFDHLFAGVMPVEVLRRDEDREDLGWIVSKKGDGWTITMFNYSLLREPLVIRPMESCSVYAEYPYRQVPFQIVARTPVEDMMEWYEDRDVNWEMKDGKAVISESMGPGEIRVYELQPKKIEMPPRTRHVNYALNKPVIASSTMGGSAFGTAGMTECKPERAVDGIRNNDDFWWSDADAKSRRFEMPQWLMVDFGEKTIDHVFVLFHYWLHESLDTRLRVYKYIVEASSDGKNWQKVLDESKSEKNASRWGLERWFDPVQARYARLTVLRNSADCGAQVVEFAVYGPEKETYTPQRKSIVPLWEAQYSRSVKEVPAAKLVYLIDLKPEKEPSIGWLPAGAKWEQMNGPAKLMTSPAQDGKIYTNCIYGQAKSEIVYRIPEGCRTFAAAAGLGTASAASSVEFKVYVDGKEKYTSGLYKLGDRIQPVVVDVEGGKELKLEVMDGGNGANDDYAFWGEARLIKK